MPNREGLTNTQRLLSLTPAHQTGSSVLVVTTSCSVMDIGSLSIGNTMMSAHHAGSKVNPAFRVGYRILRR